jgi:hypothetical protein
VVAARGDLRDLPAPVAGEIVLSTHLDGGAGALRADEGVVLRI